MHDTETIQGVRYSTYYLKELLQFTRAIIFR